MNYSALDRLIHRIAFSSTAIQLTACDIEEKLFANHYHNVTAAHPVFITSLPRAGTTLLLEALNRFPSVATHTYRDMPFVMAPLLWSKLSGIFRKQASLSERAHGDGMQVGYDSPEAFEEMIWQTFWPEKYSNTRIQLWDASDIKDEALEFLALHFKKIITLRCPHIQGDAHYVSKNNGNIARISILRAMFPSAQIVVPLRNPAAHAQSLLTQHRNFCALHSEESFVRQYMADIGHYEFGELHRPIQFPNLDTMIEGRDINSIDYWLAYWVTAFKYIRSKKDEIYLLSYEDTCSGGKDALEKFCRLLGIDDGESLEEAAALFRPSVDTDSRTLVQDIQLLHEAEDLFHELHAHAV